MSFKMKRTLEMRRVESAFADYLENEDSIDLLWSDKVGYVFLTINEKTHQSDGGRGKKKPRKSERVMTTPLFMLRCVQLGISIADLDLLTIGLVNDMFTERQNDEYPYQELASQADFDRF